MRTCSIDDCTAKHYAHGLCSRHYQRRGNPLAKRPTAHDWLLSAIATEAAECIDWPFALSHGYGVLRINRKTVRAHRLACEIVHGPAPAGREVAHSCGRASCVNPAHLRWATPAENQGDRLMHGTHNRGERYGAAKLTTEAVRTIRAEIARGVLHRDLAERFAVSAVTISNIATRTSWAWLDEVAA